MHALRGKDDEVAIIGQDTQHGIDHWRGWQFRTSLISSIGPFIFEMTRSVFKGLGSFGISVNFIASGLIDSDMTRGLKDDVKDV